MCNILAMFIRLKVLTHLALKVSPFHFSQVAHKLYLQPKCFVVQLWIE